MDAFERFPLLLAHREWKQAQAARELGCSQSMVSLVLHRERVPGRALANAIERSSFTMPGGPIRSSDWDLVEAARDGSDLAEPANDASVPDEAA